MMKEEIAEPQWMKTVDARAKTFSRAIEARFDSKLSKTLDEILTEKPTEKEVVEKSGMVLNSMFDVFLGTCIGMICKHANSSVEIEQRVVANVHRWFEALRAMGEKNGNH